MFIELLMVLAGISSSISSSRLPALEQVMRDTLKQVMRCPEWATDEDIEQPIAAFSPARYMQLVALVRKDSGENSCGRRSQLPFHLNNPRSWNFCGMGICSEDQSCSCFKDFVGEKCNKFQGRCWLFYCRLVGCNKEAPTLYCSCSPSLYGSPVARGIYFYDHGFEQNYIPPPFGYATTAFVDSHLIRKTGPGQFEIIGGNYNSDAKAIRSYVSTKYSYNVPRFKYRYLPQGQNEEEFNERKEIYRKHFQDSEPRMPPAIPGNYRKLNTNYPSPKLKGFYVSKPYRWSEVEEDVPNSNDILQTSRPVIEYANANEQRIQPGKITSNFFQRRTDRAERTGSDMQMKTYLENDEHAIFQYPNRDGDKFRHKWQERDRSASGMQRKSIPSYSYNSNDFFLRNYPDFRYNKGFPNREENKRILYNPDYYRIRRQEGLGQMELSTIKETWADDEEESGEDENFKFVSGSQANRFSLFSALICSIFITFILHFLE